MKGGVNILRILNKVQIYGEAPTLVFVTSFDNTKDVQDAPELHVAFRGEASVVKVEPMSADEDDGDGPNHLTEHAARSVRASGGIQRWTCCSNDKPKH